MVISYIFSHIFIFLWLSSSKILIFRISLYTNDYKMNRMLNFSVKFLLIIISIGFYSCFQNNRENSSEVKELSYQGISFNYPSDWRSETENYAEGSYYMEVEKVYDTFMVTFSPGSGSDPEVAIESYIEIIKNDKLKVTSKPVSSGKFGKYDCCYADILVTAMGHKFYNTVYALDIEGNTVLVIKQSDTEKKLVDNFKLMEETFHVAETESVESGDNE